MSMKSWYDEHAYGVGVVGGIILLVVWFGFLRP